MSLERRAIKGAKWLALFRTGGQAISWLTTILVARMLSPEDYGLMEMATIFTGYIFLFSELGLGAAIIQKQQVNQNELSSLFWFLFAWAFLLGFACCLLAYPTAGFFHQSRLIRITQASALLFILGALIIIPKNLLHRDVEFKKIGFIEATSTLMSCVYMLIAAKSGLGVWTLIGGFIVGSMSRSVMYLYFSKWLPSLHFCFRETKQFLKFGLNVAASNSFTYIYGKADRFFGGKFLGSVTLGYYSMAQQLANMPSEKIIFIINSVSFPVLSRYQDQPQKFNMFYLRVTALTAMIVFPLYCGAFMVSDSLIPLVLGEKWALVITPFKILCLSQLIVSLTSINSFMFNAKGLPKINLYVSIAYVLLLPGSFYMAVQYGLGMLAIPLITIVPVIKFLHHSYALKILSISWKNYFGAIYHAFIGTVLMALCVFLAQQLDFSFQSSQLCSWMSLGVTISFGGVSYVVYNFLFNKAGTEMLISRNIEDNV